MGVFLSFAMFLTFFFKAPEEPKLTLDESCDLDVENEEVLTLQETKDLVSLNTLALLKRKRSIWNLWY